ncbi:histidine kinase [Devosia pacifica]|uniref:histidine kinase n=1 Tax=Devosia pacifica TaxID=1335967 RepID=A0A918SGE9_9HYPH|nr:ATP-binding protein [Devosia pacifica]GHA37884.1 histidine kinase [Devosia pacifica]
MSSASVTVDNCAAEPIRVPGGIQPHGALLVIGPGGRIIQRSANAAEFLDGEVTKLDELPDVVGEWANSDTSTLLQSISYRDRNFQVSGHRSDQGLIVEFESPPDDEAAALDKIYPRLQSLADAIGQIEDLGEVAQIVTDEVRDIIGYDRVMVYSFDRDWHGTVIAESLGGALESYLDLRFPASDIPAQARELYRTNPLRIIPDANYEPVPLDPVLNPTDGRPLDLSFAGLRSVSPIHLQYMRNMGTYASMSVSIIVDDQLWGLISCHSLESKRVSPQVRAACNFIAKLASLRISSVVRGAHAARRIELKRQETELVARLSAARDIPEALAQNGRPWLALTGATGAAVVTEKSVRTAGAVPPLDTLVRLADWLGGQEINGVFATEHLGDHWAEGADVTDTASGLLAIPISQLHPSFVMWFRPEVVSTVTWGGDPRKPMDAKTLTPRTSFAQWKQEVTGTSVPWTNAETESADDFRNALLNFILLRAEERAELSNELERSNKELESFSYSVSHDLRAPFRHIVGFAELLMERERNLDEKSRHYLQNITDAALSAGRLVDDLLSFSQLGRARVEKSRVDMNKLVSEVQRSLEPDINGRNVRWDVGDLPRAFGDGSLLRQALHNLVDNALKYSQNRDPAVIRISGDVEGNTVRYEIADNGVGFDMTYVEKLFGVFQRLHRVEDFPGTGIGLALVKRIVDRHGGRVEARGKVNEGAVFSILLPLTDKER